MAIPPDTGISLGQLSDHQGIYVLATRPPHSHRLYEAVQPQSGACWLRHGPGVGWPDRHGLTLLQAALAEPGAAVVLEFATLLDARQCLARLTSPAFDYWCRTCC